MNSNELKCDYSFRIVLVGDPTVGKTTILLRFVDNVFMADNVSTSGATEKSRTVNFGKKIVRLNLVDTAGQERFRTVSKSFYSDADGVVIVYDQSNEKSFLNVSPWLREVEKFAQKEHLYKVIAGNKADLNGIVPTDNGKHLATEQGTQFFHTSAKNDTNIDQLFQHLVQTLGARLYRDEDWNKFRIQRPGSAPQKKKGFCTIL